jgi:hypothetical protein
MEVETGSTIPLNNLVKQNRCRYARQQVGRDVLAESNVAWLCINNTGTAMTIRLHELAHNVCDRSGRVGIINHDTFDLHWERASTHTIRAWVSHRYDPTGDVRQILGSASKLRRFEHTVREDWISRVRIQDTLRDRINGKRTEVRRGWTRQKLAVSLFLLQTAFKVTAAAMLHTHSQVAKMMGVLCCSSEQKVTVNETKKQQRRVRKKKNGR